jgi:CopG antitoxin of type II toxin-antitoxin system
LGNSRLRRLRRLEQGRARALTKPETLDHSDFNSPAAGLLEQIKIAANKRDVPYQSLIKMWLAEKVG